MSDRRKPEDAQGLCTENVAGQGPTVLVIDDQHMILDVFEGGLATAGYAVLKAASGREGLRLFKENHVDMILCDLGMPRMDGWEVAEAIRDFCEELGLVKPPLILVTAWAEQIYGDERISKLEIDAVLGKPVSIDALLQTVAGEIAKRRRDSAGA